MHGVVTPRAARGRPEIHSMQSPCSVRRECCFTPSATAQRNLTGTVLLFPGSSVLAQILKHTVAVSLA